MSAVDYKDLMDKERADKSKSMPLYHDICLWLPHRPEVAEDIAKDMAINGFRPERAIITFEGQILDGRHRYEAAKIAGVQPIYTEFHGTIEEAIALVASENVARRHLSSPEKEFFYVQVVEHTGVQSRGGDRGNQYQSGNRQNCPLAKSQADHADDLGVAPRTVKNWERDRSEIKSDPNLASSVSTPEGYKKAKKVVRDRRKEQKEAIHKAVPPKTVDLHAIARNKEGLDIGNLAPAFTGLMETLCTKFAENDIKREMSMFLSVDPLGLRVEALHRMSEILDDLREDHPVIETNKQQLN